MTRVEGWSEEATETPPSRLLHWSASHDPGRAPKPPSDICADIITRIIKHDVLYCARVVGNKNFHNSRNSNTSAPRASDGKLVMELSGPAATAAKPSQE